jgi:hypothetical protein
LNLLHATRPPRKYVHEYDQSFIAEWIEP